jgi:hypothetical protein
LISVLFIFERANGKRDKIWLLAIVGNRFFKFPFYEVLKDMLRPVMIWLIRCGVAARILFVVILLLWAILRVVGCLLF